MGKIAEFDLGHSELIDYLQAASAEMLNILQVNE